MSRKVLPLLALCAVLAPGAVVASGCGSSEPGVDVAEAAQATSSKGTARMDMRVRASGFGLPGTLDLEATGVTALREPRMNLTMDLAKLASSVGMPLRDGKAQLRVDGKDVFLRPPAIPGLGLPGGATWIAIDARRAAEGAGLDAAGLGALFAVDPAAQLQALRAAKGLDEVGEEEIDGTSTTHYKGTLRMADVVAALPAAERRNAQRALDQLDRLAGTEGEPEQPTPVELWIDDEGIARRFVSEQRTPAQKGVPGGKLSIRYDLSDFGAKLDVTAPDEDETWDATKAILGLFKNGLGAAGATPGATTTD